MVDADATSSSPRPGTLTSNPGRRTRLPAWATHMAFLIGVGAVAGIVFGLIAGEWAGNLKFIGDMFIRLIQMSIVPLVMVSVIQATGSMSGKGTGLLAFRTFKWMIGFSVVAAIVT